MNLSRQQIALVAAGMVMIAGFFLVVPAITAPIPRPWGFVVVLCAYWLVFCIPVAAAFVSREDRARLASTPLQRRDAWLIALLVLQLIGVFFGAVWPHLGVLNWAAVGLALLVGLFNGTLEELAWRGAYVSTFRDRPVVGFALNWVLFSLWHVPLALTAGMVFDGGAVALVGGSAGLGLLWSAIAFRTGSLAVVVPAHILTNAMAFSVLFATNGIG